MSSEKNITGLFGKKILEILLIALSTLFGFSSCKDDHSKDHSEKEAKQT
jgi:hypothetical protein